MMLLPYHTDAPIYHWPIATGSMIAINIYVFLLQGEAGTLAMEHGNGLHPLQWLTSMFAHANFLHLFGNMIFLWVFGIIVEGKIGPYLFALVYVGSGVSQNVIEQMIYLGATENTRSLGASSAIYAMMLISMIWAPQDNIKAIFLFFVYPIPVSIPVAMLGLIYVAWDFTAAMVAGFEIGTAILHLLGGGVGLVVGLWMVFASKVDCEQRDLISMFMQSAGGKGIKKKKSKREIAQDEEARQQRIQETRQKIDNCWKSMKRHLAAGNTRAASDIFPTIQKLDERASWNEEILFEIITQWQKQKSWNEVEYYSNEYIQQGFSRHCDIVLNMARICVVYREAPRKAIKFLQMVQGLELSDRQKLAFRQVHEKAKQLIDEGAIELDD